MPNENLIKEYYPMNVNNPNPTDPVAEARKAAKRAVLEAEAKAAAKPKVKPKAKQKK
jgi:hypothetical protein